MDKVHDLVYFSYGFIRFKMYRQLLTEELSLGRSDEKHNDILCAAIREFCEKGMMATTMEAIASRACVSKRTLYKHYPCKEDLLDAVVSLLLERVEPLQKMTFDPQRPIAEQLKELSHKVLSLVCDEHYLRLSKIVIIESMRSEKEAIRLNQKFSDCEKDMHNWFIQAGKAGALGNLEPGLAAAMFYGAIKEMAFWDQAICWKPLLNEQEAGRLIKQTCDFFLTAIQSKG
ncbi:TetR/AcrR family transcriptional regulator [Bowmanella pacifica]|uniref:TetR family transcriptional regulator n=1 Tax=Bowmanella pacifica TaxID=502051 RepID=A0A918DI42_9ALTE|nr:TetR/AcrR family transcriptional regulator [Bowmanella pacifica]GGO66484.1 TetR family transcriptional regulator [Bowmanella pacifica]